MRSGLIFDVYDDRGGELLKSIYGNSPNFSEQVKEASYLSSDERQSLPDDVFALVMVDDNSKLRKFACVDPGNTELSVQYFLQTAGNLPEEAQKVAAHNLCVACSWYDITPPEELEKMAKGFEPEDIERHIRNYAARTDIPEEQKLERLAKFRDRANTPRSRDGDHNILTHKRITAATVADHEVVTRQGKLNKAKRVAQDHADEVASAAREVAKHTKLNKLHAGIGVGAGLAAAGTAYAGYKAYSKHKENKAKDVEQPKTASIGTWARNKATGAVISGAMAIPTVMGAASEAKNRVGQVLRNPPGGLMTPENFKLGSAKFAEANGGAAMPGSRSVDTSVKDKATATVKAASTSVDSLLAGGSLPGHDHAAIHNKAEPLRQGSSGFAKFVRKVLGREESRLPDNGGPPTPIPSFKQEQDWNMQSTKGPGLDAHYPKVMLPAIDVSGSTLGYKKASVEKTASCYALRGRYPIDDVIQVKTASDYFAVWGENFSPEDRHEYCSNLVKQAAAMGMTNRLAHSIRKHGSSTYAPPGEFKYAMAQRREWLLNEPEHRQLLDELQEKSAELSPAMFAKVLTEFDKEAGLNSEYDNGIQDPYFTTFGYETRAAYSTKVAGQDVTEGSLRKLSSDIKVMRKLAQVYGDEFASEFQKDPVSIFESMPQDQKLLIINA